MNVLMAVLPARPSLPQNHLLRVTPILQAATADFDFSFKTRLVKVYEYVEILYYEHGHYYQF